MHDLKSPYLLFLGFGDNPLAIKTSRGLAQWRPDICIGETGSPLSLGLQKMTPFEGAQAGAKTFIIGLANSGGKLAADWVVTILEAIDAGLDIASGLHERLIDNPEIKLAAKKKGVQLHDIRHQIGRLTVGTGTKRSGTRILTVGTDCSVGKMYTALAIEQEMKKRNFNVDFRATGQTGIFIAGGGIPIDAVVSDFISGAVEQLCPNQETDHWDIIEGQGSLFNPAFAGVSLGLIHGAQPDILVMCHEANRERIKDMAEFPIPDLRDCIDTNLKMARLTNPNVQLGAISLNCRVIGPELADQYCAELSQEFSVPCFDPMIHGTKQLVNRLERNSTSNLR
tara:strand:- start:447 stop:1463 length:1017 start_codon:yes stop_codon:yes gene_type:complete